MLEEALLNPKTARDLQNKATGYNITRAAELIFKDEIAKALGRDATLGQNIGKAAKVAPFALTNSEGQDGATVAPTPKKPTFKKQEAVTSKKSFPTPEDLLNPPAPGQLKKTSLDVKGLINQQSPEIQAQIAAESSGNPYAVSPKGAQGLMQLMPATAQDIAQKLGEPYMPLNAGMPPEQQMAATEQNIRFGEYYLKKELPRIHKAFKNPTLAWAAYNAGPQRVKEAMAMAGTETDVNKILSRLPIGVQKETIPYVDKIVSRLTRG
jgi:hypothetical protein